MKWTSLRNQFDLLMIFTLLGIVPALFYYLLAKKEIFLGLTWNVFLALLPFYFALKATSANTSLKRNFSAFLWVIFLPNAPYIITDVAHVPLNEGYKGFVLYLVAILSLTGLLSWFFSVSLMLRKLPILLNNWKRLRRWTYLFLCIISGVGVSMGRFARLNSWELFYKPMEVFTSTIDMYSEVKPWAVTILITSILYILRFFPKLQPLTYYRTIEKI